MRNKIVAVTGGIGAGKSLVMSMIGKLGYPVIGLDGIYGELLKDEVFLRSVCDCVGVPPIVSDGVLALDRKSVSGKVFTDSQLLKRLNDLTHPAILNEMKRRAKTFDKTVFCEVPLLYECSLEGQFDYVVVIIRDVRERVTSVSLRDGKDEKEVLSVLKNQFDYSNLRTNEHTIVIENNCTEFELESKIRSAISEIEGD